MEPRETAGTERSTDNSSDAWVPHVGTYRRELPVSLERLYENALDWEHLPWLHQSSFCDIACLDAGDWGWRARVGLQPVSNRSEVVLELLLDRQSRRWITRTTAGSGRGSEIWTHAFAVAEHRTDIVVDFFVVGVTRDQADTVGSAYTTLYERLYDEDVSMMSERQRQIDRSAARMKPSPVKLGCVADVKQRLPLIVETAGRRFRVVELDGRLVAHSTLCPHQLGPLDQGEVMQGIIQCPWHGYRFDVRTGENVSGQRCRLAPPATVNVDPETTEVTFCFDDSTR